MIQIAVLRLRLLTKLHPPLLSLSISLSPPLPLPPSLLSDLPGPEWNRPLIAGKFVEISENFKVERGVDREKERGSGVEAEGERRTAQKGVKITEKGKE